MNGKAFIAFASGQMPDSRRMAIESIAKYEGAAASFASMLIAQRAAIYMHDTEALRADAAWLRERSFGARWAERISRSAEAALMALEERHGESVLLYREVIDEWRDADLPFDLALTLLERSVVLPMTDREVARGRDEARALLDGLGATGLADRLLASAPNAAPAGAGANVAAAVTPDQERAAQATR